MSVVVYPGSFDPITMGHIDIIQRISQQFSEVIVLVAHSAEKKYLFSSDERVSLAEECLSHLTNVKIDIHEGLTIDYMQKRGAKTIVRGLRAVVDFEYELAMANLNKKLANNIETLLVFASPEYYYVSSKGVKEVATFDGDLKGLVPNHVIGPLKEKLQK